MTILAARPGTALLVIDAQNEVLAAAAGRTARAVPAGEVSFG